MDSTLTCRKEYYSKWADENKERRKKYRQEWYIKNKERIRKDRKEYNKNYYLKNRKSILSKNKKWAQSNKGKVTAKTRKRQAAKLNATFSDYGKEIERFYILSRHFTEVTGIQHHVDHIEPLQGKNSCGLHVPWNLQILTAEENLRKGNRL